MTARIISAYVANNKVQPPDLPAIIQSVYQTLSALRKGNTPTPLQKPAVPISESVQKDYIVCLEDGRELKMLKRYLRSRYNMTPEEYRAKWGLPAEYPMVAPNYAKLRSAHAKEIGLGKNRQASET